MSNPRKVKGYFTKNFDLAHSSNGWHSFNCPFCGDDKNKMSIHFHYAYTKCWICGYSEHAVRFISEYEDVSIKSAKDKLKASGSLKLSPIKATVYKDSPQIHMPEGYKSISEVSGSLAERARKYLIGRGFDIDVLDTMGFGYCDNPESDYFGRIIIPFKQHGRLIYYIGRDFIGNYLRYHNPPRDQIGIGKGDVLFNADALEIFDTVFVTEGWSDALTVGQNGISTQGWSLSPKQSEQILISSCDELVFAPDAGTDGSGESFYKKALHTAIKFIGHKKIKVLNLNTFTEGKDVNELGKEVIMDLYKRTFFTDFKKIMEDILE